MPLKHTKLPLMDKTKIKSVNPLLSYAPQEKKLSQISEFMEVEMPRKNLVAHKLMSAGFTEVWD